MTKTVYILGAGFSHPAGFPLQKELLKEVTSDMLFLEGGILSRPVGSKQIQKDQERVKTFYEKCFSRDMDVSFEDIFTLLDQVIAERAHFAGYPEEQLREVRRAWIKTILFALHKISDLHLRRPTSAHKSLAAGLIKERIDAGKNADPFSIVSLNWDSLVEDSVFSVLEATGGIRNKRALVDIDYCVYTMPLKGSPHTPSVKQKALGIFNLKLLKMHGSSTWLRCPCSERIYTGLGLSTSARETYVKRTCSPFIKKHMDAREKDSPSVLEPIIITPTFSKVFDLPHIRGTWQNAFVELREAEKVVFIGYSLPDADYHFRTLLRRSVRWTTPVKVYLHQNDDPAKSTAPGGIFPEARYRQVFCNQDLAFDYTGLEGFVENYAPQHETPSVTAYLSGELAKINSQT